MIFVTDTETYLGDGLYASFDGFQFCLRAPREHGDHVVYLEPRTLVAFQAFVVETYGKAETTPQPLMSPSTT